MSAAVCRCLDTLPSPWHSATVLILFNCLQLSPQSATVWIGHGLCSIWTCSQTPTPCLMSYLTLAYSAFLSPTVPYSSLLFLTLPYSFHLFLTLSSSSSVCPTRPYSSSVFLLLFLTLHYYSLLCPTLLTSNVFSWIIAPFTKFMFRAFFRTFQWLICETHQGEKCILFFGKDQGKYIRLTSSAASIWELLLDCPV